MDDNPEYKIPGYIKSVLKRNGFRLNELSHENFKKKLQESPTENGGSELGPLNSPQKSQERTIIRAKGHVICQHSVFGVDGPYYAKHMAILEEYPQHVFINFTFKSRLFDYNIEGYEMDDYFMNRKKFYCEYISWTPVKFDMFVAEYFIALVGLSGDAVAEFVLDALPEDEFIERGKNETYEKATYKKDFLLRFLEIGYSEAFSLLKTQKEAKRYFLADDFKLLCMKTESTTKNGHVLECPPIYPENVILQMSWKSITELAQTLKENPYILAFEPLTNFFYVPSSEMMENNPTLIGKNTPIPEISLSQVQWIVNTLYPQQDAAENVLIKFCAIDMYEVLKKEAFEKKHVCTRVIELYNLTNSSTFSRATKEKSLEFLLDNNIATLTADGFVFIQYMYYWERCISLSVMCLYERHKFDQKLGSKVLDISRNLTTLGGHPLCNEQTTAITKFLENPIVLVNGLPGSGKTDMLSALAPCMPPETVFACAIKGIHVAKLNSIFPTRAFTAHMLLYFHDKYCQSSPHIENNWQTTASDPDNNHTNNNNPDVQDSDKISEELFIKNSLKLKFIACPFEKTEFLVIDEISNWDDAIFSKLLSAITCCGKLKKVFMLGDSNQLPSIRCGNVIKELTEFCREMDTLCEFVHNHRTSQSSKILRHNTDCLINRDISSLQFDNINCIHIDLDITEKKSTHQMQAMLLSVLRKYNVHEYQHQVITRTNKFKDLFSDTIEEYYYNKDSQHTKEYKKRGHYVGRKISFTQNNYRLKVLNNELLVLESIVDYPTGPNAAKRKATEIKNTAEKIPREYSRLLTLRSLDDSKKIELLFSEWVKKHLKHASASTIEIYQGSEADDVIYILPYWSRFDTFESVLTAWTRARKRFFFMGNLQDLAKAIKTPEPPRRSKLKQLLLDSCYRYKNLRDDQQISATPEKDIALHFESASSIVGLKSSIFIFFFQITIYFYFSLY